ncbi:MAG: hypothetical protein LBN30_01250 [Oscillospiraceae bacterium]|jgi:hypothetical protein|nr:hypothetical protein [Oscillospiraceae bacterium]
MPETYRGDCPSLTDRRTAEHETRLAPPKGQTNVKQPNNADNSLNSPKTKA